MGNVVQQTRTFEGVKNRYPNIPAYRMDAALPEVPVVYLYLHNVSGDPAKVLYVGQTDNLKRRHDEHRNTDSWFTAATEVCAIRASTKEERNVWEADLIAHYRPPHNIQRAW